MTLNLEFDTLEILLEDFYRSKRLNKSILEILDYEVVSKIIVVEIVLVTVVFEMLKLFIFCCFIIALIVRYFSNSFLFNRFFFYL